MTISGAGTFNLDGLANLTSVGGYVYIFGTGLANLDGLSNLTSVGDLIIQSNTVLSNIDGLSNLSTVDGDLHFQSNSALTNIDGLSNLSSVVGYLLIEMNSVLTNIDGLSNLSFVPGYLNIFNNVALADVDGLSNLASVGGNFVISSNTALTNLDGLSNLSSVAGTINFLFNNTLMNLDGLSNLSSVGGSFIFSFNPSLTNLDGLSKLSSVGGNLGFSSNATLTNLDGLSNLSSVGGGLLIQNNTGLTNVSDYCGLYTLLNYNGPNGSYVVSGNTANPSINDILALGDACPVLYKSFTGTPTTICQGQSIDLRDLIVGTFNDSIRFGTTFGSYNLNPIVAHTESTTYFVYDSLSAGRYDTAQIVVTVLDETMCLMSFQSQNRLSFDDPCHCEAYLVIDGVWHVRDTLVVTAVPGLNLVFVSAGSSGLFDAQGLPIADGTPFTPNPDQTDQYKLEIFKHLGVQAVGFVDYGQGPILIDQEALPVCTAADCPELSIPTMGQWALIILMLGFLLVGVVAGQQKKLGRTII